MIGGLMNATFTPARLAALLLPVAILAAAPQVPPAPAPFTDDDEAYEGEAPERYAMVRALEGEVHIFKGDLDELLSRGTPIAEGDVVESRGRGVLQLGDGTRVAFGGATRFTIATLFTDRNGEKQVLLRLDYGRLRVHLGGQADVRFRVDTPSGTATCLDTGSFTLDAERDRVVRLRVLTGRVAFANDRDQAQIPAGERLTVYSPQDGLDRVRPFNTFEGDDFDRWSEQALVVRHGESWDRVPPEIRNYADELDRNGRWIDSGEFGWVWQPAGVAEDWRPYYEGRWAPYAGGMTWISDEPWAYVAYHHGRWHWGAGVGWFWIPGIHYSPAWVAWNQTPGYCGWAPLGYYNTPCHWGYGAWGGGYAWNVVAINFINEPHLHRRMNSDVRVLHTFNGGPGGAPWTPGGRDLRPPWQRSPLIVSRTEFRNPGQLQVAFQRDVHRERMVAYERHAQATTGRVVIHRDLRPAPGGSRPGSPQSGPVRVPFEGRDPRPSPGPQQPRGPEPRPLDRLREPIPDHRVEAPRERAPEPRPLDRLREPIPDHRVEAPRERAPEPRPLDRVREPIPDHRVEAPRERAPEPRPVDRVREPIPDHRVEAPRERPPEPRPERRPEERRPDPPKAERESRTPRPEPVRERPREEKPREEKRN
jgi:hypothetical protein